MDEITITTFDEPTLRQKVADFHKDQELSPLQADNLRRAEEILNGNDEWFIIKKTLLYELRIGSKLEEVISTINLYSDNEWLRNLQEREVATAYIKRRYEKRQALSELQGQAVDEQVDFGNARADLISKVKKNPDVSKDQLSSHLEFLKSEGLLTDSQLQELSRWIHIYQRKRQNINTIRSEYPDDDDLVEHLYGIVPNKFQVIEGIIVTVQGLPKA